MLSKPDDPSHLQAVGLSFLAFFTQPPHDVCLHWSGAVMLYPTIGTERMLAGLATIRPIGRISLLVLIATLRFLTWACAHWAAMPVSRYVGLWVCGSVCRSGLGLRPLV
jgi:hypothetical protein